MAKRKAFNILSPEQFVDFFAAGLSEDDKNDIVKTIEKNTKIDQEDLLRFRAILDPDLEASLTKPIKTCQMTSKTWDSLHSVSMVVSGEKEYDKEGNLIYRKEIFDSIYSKRYFGIENEDEFEDSERLVRQAFDERGLLIEKQFTLNDNHIIERYTYDSEGRVLSFTRVYGDGSEQQWDFEYLKNEEGYVWKYCHNDWDGVFVAQIIDEKGRIIYDTIQEFVENGSEYSYTIFLYQYDDQERITDVYSYVPGKEGSGRGKHIEYLEEDGKKKTVTSIYAMSPCNENADLLNNTESWEMGEEPIEQYTFSEWTEDDACVSELRNDLTERAELTRRYLDDEGFPFKQIVFVSEKEEMTERSVSLLNKNGQVLDTLSFSKGVVLFWHTVNHYSEDGLLVFSSNTYIPRESSLPHVRQILSWYDYTLFD